MQFPQTSSASRTTSTSSALGAPRAPGTEPPAAVELARYGWDEARREELSALAPPPGVVPGRVVRLDRGRCEVVTAAGAVRAEVPAALAPDPVSAPATGDWVLLDPGAGPRVTAVLPRRAVLVRAATAGHSHGQVLAANVDDVVVVAPLDERLRPGRLERLLALAWESGARPLVVLTKADVAADPEAAVAEAALTAPGAEVLAVSATTGAGTGELARRLRGTAVLIGPSGAGKSSLANALLGHEALAVGAVREGDRRGRHTSVRRELVPLPGGGALVDTPGLRSVGLQEAAAGLQRVFADVEEFSADCRFSDCGHAGEPGCAVLAAVDADVLPRRRLDSYLALQREEARASARTDQRLRAEERRRHRVLAREQRRLRTERGR
ncbi:ribosome small subunit-dependent GTPase A [Kineococcus glutinatus]|uniref:Small ribosomal subunit biogenesis GTPase RsgA n=1 Tax=Kineococcus glutinatus TaxID=1070872 RepID=A0ABP9H3M9_9ACTN